MANSTQQMNATVADLQKQLDALNQIIIISWFKMKKVR